MEDLGIDPQTAIAVMQRVNLLIMQRKPHDADAVLNEFPQLKKALFEFEPED